MPRFAANLSFLYTEVDFLDRFALAAADGFDAVECLFPYEWPSDAIAQRLAAHRLELVLFNAPPGDWAAGERGIACLPGREAEFRRGFVERALPAARALGVRRLHVLAGIVPPGADEAALRASYLDNLAWAARTAAVDGIDLLIEPINRHDMPGYWLTRQADAHAVVAELALPNLKVQMDLYHCARVEGDVAAELRRWLPGGRVGHLQIAAVPGRHEPDGGALDWPALFALIDELGWPGSVGCEYRPRGATRDGLGWLRRQRQRAGRGEGAAGR